MRSVGGQSVPRAVPCLCRTSFVSVRFGFGVQAVCSRVHATARCNAIKHSPVNAITGYKGVPLQQGGQ
ncbi:hypothetical protein DSM101010T_11080 [Desulfovibrio subterraneus]|uniref:Uncharacterized protein n=1 Tax=Desulfovibrio subterraneus TaxID=2718620 RepID=A0A7J0BG78_9BACT|nr:hypothetical protein DSM101010T_11080 [Desulfovibrio subterraneus]